MAKYEPKSIVCLILCETGVHVHYMMFKQKGIIFTLYFKTEIIITIFAIPANIQSVIDNHATLKLFCFLTLSRTKGTQLYTFFTPGQTTRVPEACGLSAISDVHCTLHC